MNKKIIVTLSLAIFLLAAYFRLHGVNWDQDQHLHPDERFLTMVTQGISWPKDVQAYLDTSTSPLNPHNRGFGFFVYGTFPLFLTKWVADLLGMGDYRNVTLVGRQLSAIVDIGTVILVYLVAQQVVNSGMRKRTVENDRLRTYVPLFSSFFYATMVFPIQLSHFYAVDTYLTFFIALTFYFLMRLLLTAHFSLLTSLALGISFGLALASKVTAALFLPIIGLGFLWCLVKHKNKQGVLVSCFLFLVSCFLTFRFTQPYLFANSGIFDVTLNSKVIENWKELKSFDGADTWFPPSVQWIHTQPYIFPLKNMIFWGLGLPLSILSIAGLIYLIVTLIHSFTVSVKKNVFRRFTNHTMALWLILVWIVLLFIYQGMQFSKTMRYFYPIYPFRALLSGYAFFQFFLWVKNRKPKLLILIFCPLGFVLLYPISFMSIYSHPHARVAASEWIYKNIPLGTTIGGEHWDDFIPLGMDGKSVWTYKPIELPLYGADTPEKWGDLDSKLKEIEFIILSSNRLYGSIMTVPERYPITSRYYQALFDGSLGFKKIAEFTSRPNIPLPFVKRCLTPPFVRYGIVARKSQECPLPGISLVDDYADESFTVYDHPKVVIFQKVRPENYFNLLVKAQ